MGVWRFGKHDRPLAPVAGLLDFAATILCGGNFTIAATVLLYRGHAAWTSNHRLVPSDRSKMSSPTRKRAKVGGGQLDAAETAETEETFFLYEGGEIDDDTFSKGKLTRIRVDPRVTCIPDEAFSGCINLAEVQLHEGLQTIGRGAFRNCSALRSVTLPPSVTALGGGALYGCSRLLVAQLNEGLLTIGDWAFHNCWALRSVNIPSTVTSLGLGAFRSAFQIYPTDMQLNEGLQNIGQNAFGNCLGLRSVSIPSTITKLETWAFSSCNKLTDVKLAEGLKIICVGAFHGCTALQSVTIPSTVRVVVEHAFDSCSNLSEVILLGGQRVPQP